MKLVISIPVQERFQSEEEAHLLRMIRGSDRATHIVVLGIEYFVKEVVTNVVSPIQSAWALVQPRGMTTITLIRIFK